MAVVGPIKPVIAKTDAVVTDDRGVQRMIFAGRPVPEPLRAAYEAVTKPKKSEPKKVQTEPEKAQIEPEEHKAQLEPEFTKAVKAPSETKTVKQRSRKRS